jgi:multicomponent Na+:H+ antiporter subunit A
LLILPGLILLALAAVPVAALALRRAPAAAPAWALLPALLFALLWLTPEGASFRWPSLPSLGSSGLSGSTASRG